MKRTYNTGLENNQIELDVSVGTVGVANTVVTQRWSGGTSKVIRESDADSGNIPAFIAGTAEELKNSYLVITTIIDFDQVPKPDWDKARKSTVVYYTLDGGFSGHQYFNFDTDDMVSSQGGKISVITKPIELL